EGPPGPFPGARPPPPRGSEPGRGPVGRVERDEDELVAERAQLLEGEWMRILVPAEGGRVVEGQRQVRMRLAHRLGEGHRRLARRVRQLAPDQVHARVGVGAAATDRLFEAPTDGTVGVGPGDDDEVAVEAIARVDGRAVLTQRLLEADDRLARDVAAALWEALVFQVDPRHAG